MSIRSDTTRSVRARFVVALGALSACASPSDDVTGPFTGETRSFLVDAIRVPRDASEATMLAADLDGDDRTESDRARKQAEANRRPEQRDERHRQIKGKRRASLRRNDSEGDDK